MSQLIVFALPTPDGAYAMREALDELRRQDVIELGDAAVVERAADGKVRLQQATNLVGAGALGGAAWGALVGLAFLSPWLGLAVGAVAGALAGRFTDIGIDDDFIHQLAKTITPGQSALFLLIDRWDEPTVLAQLAAFDATILRTSLAADEEARLRAVLGDDPI
ncbi:MAG: DUF1269 domain-containing protein [Candidatus Promineofilum sp.]|jgi:uncharacterized membrane protein|nr:DUF1269 domain-containing protein [Promineifilum sp.]